MRFTAQSLVLILVASLAFWGCEGPEGPQGPAGANPAMGPVITTLLAVPDSIGTNQSTQFIVSAYDPNGDAITYHWVVPVGSVNSATVSNPMWTATDSMGLFTFTVHAIAGGDTTAGTLLVGVNTYVPSVMPYYLGNNQESCAHCHDGKIMTWSETHHATAYKASEESCNECHSTGWDETLDNGGYDDNPVAAMQNVQCEGCHGPMGPNPAVNEPNVEGTLSGETCSECHESFFADWGQSQHGTVIEEEGYDFFIEEWGSFSDCDHCHIAEGFLYTWDNDWTTDPNLSWYEEHGAHEIGCGTCHDAHELHVLDGDTLQLRALDDIELPNPDGYTISGWGAGQLCGNCHHDRRTPSTIESYLNNGSSHFGPHGSPQADMVEGTGTYEIPGYSYPVTANQHDGILDEACVSCHVVIEEGTPHIASSGHTYEPQLSMCQNCHTTATSFDVGGVQTETQALMDELANMIMANNPAITEFTSTQLGDTTISNYEDRVASWAYFKVENDKSTGVHNRDYAALILQNSIDYYGTVVAGKRNDDNLWGLK